MSKMIISYFAIRKSKSESTRRGNSSSFILEGGELKMSHTSGGESVINPKKYLYFEVNK